MMFDCVAEVFLRFGFFLHFFKFGGCGLPILLICLCGALSGFFVVTRHVRFVAVCVDTSLRAVLAHLA